MRLRDARGKPEANEPSECEGNEGHCHRDCCMPTGVQVLKGAFWGRLGSYEKDSLYHQIETGAG